MPLSIGTTYDNVFYDYVLTPLKNLFKDEFPSSAVYIAPEIQNVGNFEVRIWGNSSETEEKRLNSWSKIYNVDVDIYLKEPNPNEAFYELLYTRSEAAYQLLFNNITKETTVGSVTRTWIDGSVSDTLINELNDEEDDIEGLNKISLNFSCVIERS